MVKRWHVSKELASLGFAAIALGLLGSGCVLEQADPTAARMALSTGEALSAELEDAVSADAVSVEAVSVEAESASATLEEGEASATGEAAGTPTPDAVIEIEHCAEGDTQRERLGIQLGLHDQPLTEDDRVTLLGLLVTLGSTAELIEIASTMLEAVGVDVPGVGFVDPSSVFDAAVSAASASLRSSYRMAAQGGGWRVIAVASWDVCTDGVWVKMEKVLDVERPARRWVHPLYATDPTRWLADAFSERNAAAALRDAATAVADELGWRTAAR